MTAPEERNPFHLILLSLIACGGRLLRSSIQSAPKSQTTMILLARRQVVSFRLLFCAFPSPSARQAHIFYASLFHTRPDATNVA